MYDTVTKIAEMDKTTTRHVNLFNHFSTSTIKYPNTFITVANEINELKNHVKA
jgi:hypothetical protein